MVDIPQSLGSPRKEEMLNALGATQEPGQIVIISIGLAQDKIPARHVDGVTMLNYCKFALPGQLFASFRVPIQ